MRTIENEITGEIPADLSEQASTLRNQRTKTADCRVTEAPEEWAHWSHTSLAEKCARLATVPEHWKNAEFAHSLAKQFAYNGFISPKQEAWVQTLYTEYTNTTHWLRAGALRHDWQKVGSITHYYNTVLGTYSATDFHKCTKCGELGETYDVNNYSGD